MGLILLIVVLLLLFGGGGGYYGYRRWGSGGGIGIVGVVLIVLVCLYLFGGLRLPWMRKPGAHTGSALEIFMEPLTAFYRMAGDVPAIRGGVVNTVQRPRN